MVYRPSIGLGALQVAYTVYRPILMVMMMMMMMMMIMMMMMNCDLIFNVPNCGHVMLF